MLKDEILTIGLAGDVMLGRSMNDIISRKGYDYPWGNILPALKQTDLNIINLETTLTRGSDKAHKTFNFKSDPKNVRSLINANTTVANLANNHILDFGHVGLIDTLQTLDSANIQHIGAGVDWVSASAPLVIQRKTFTIGLIGLTDNEPQWKANDGPGSHYIDIDDERQYAPVLNAIRELRKATDLVIVSIHWGPNMREAPPQQFISFAHLTSQYGANIIHGHSAHILQGIEHYDNSLILYDTGDFIDDYVVDEHLRNDLSAFFEVTVDKSGLRSLQITPTRISEYQVNHATHEDHNWVIRRLRYLSLAFDTHISREGKIELNQALHR